MTITPPLHLLPRPPNSEQPIIHYTRQPGNFCPYKICVCRSKMRCFNFEVTTWSNTWHW